MNSDIALQMRICQLETKNEMLEQQIRILENHIEKFDTNLRLSIQNQSMNNRYPGQNSSQSKHNFGLKLFDIIELNLKSIDREKIASLLENHAPSFPSVVQIVVNTINGPHTTSPILKIVTNSLSAYMNDNGDTIMEQTTTLFDKIFAKVYNRCKDVVLDLNDATENTSSYSDDDAIKLHNRYENMRLLYDSKVKILKELTPLFK